MLKDTLYKIFFSEETSIEGRNLYLLYIFGSVAALGVTIVRFIQGYSVISNLVPLGTFTVGIVLFLLTYKFKMHNISARVAIVLICHIILPLLFFTNGGLHSGIAGFFVMSIVLIFQVLKGKECGLHIILNIIIITICYKISIERPELVIPIDSVSKQLVDSLQTIFIAGLFIGTSIKVHTKMYEIEKRKAEDATKAKGDFLANVSHEIRTPLNAIIGLGELELQKNLDKDTYDNLEKIYQSGNILLNIINDLLDVSKIEAGYFNLLPADYQISNLINDTIGINLVRIGSKPIIFRLRVDENIPNTLRGDELRIRQILNNLLSNAFKYTKEGRVNLAISYERNPLTPNTITLVCSVEDTGIGIKESDRSKLFSVYNQLDMESNRHIEGTGLGLSICKNLATMMGGTILVKSEYGKGSIFTVRIQQEIVDEKPIGIRIAQNLESFQFITYGRERRKGGPRFQLPYAKVLVVDDVSLNLDVTKGMLLPYNMRIDCVTSGQEAIDKIIDSEVQYDAIFMDHMMPEMDGIQAVHFIRNEINTEYAKTVPIIALTANAIIGNERMFLDNGFQDYVTKPLDMARLDTVLSRWVRDNKKERLFENEEIQQAKTNGQIPLKIASFSVSGLDIKDGLARLGNKEEVYISILKSFVKSIPELLSGIKTCSPETLEDYAIKVHGIKGASFNIGAQRVGKQAEELEIAARKGDMTAIRLQNDLLIKNVEALIDDIKNCLKKWAALYEK